jgi:hypothetical protein
MVGRGYGYHGVWVYTHMIMGMYPRWEYTWVDKIFVLANLLIDIYFTILQSLLILSNSSYC